MSRRWHVEHADGREWTQFELNELAARLAMRTGCVSLHRENQVLCIDRCGAPILIDGFGAWWYVDAEREDMEVVWDG